MTQIEELTLGDIADLAAFALPLHDAGVPKVQMDSAHAVSLITLATKAHEQAALIASQARRVEELEAFYRAVAHAAGDLDQLPDSHAFEVVWCNSDEDGNPAPGDPFITAGMIRRASRALLNRGEG